jgi:filamentous hemagglutinin family protein
MIRQVKQFSIAKLALLVGLGLTPMPRAGAQILPDGTLPTVVTSPDRLNFAIEGGSRSGSNLFHSFSQFSVPTGGSAVFNNPLDVQNIFSRVTGGSVSNIDGVIKANGAANLFLLNPNGLVFGPQAILNIGGSFLGTTASHVRFEDGSTFSATNPTPLLTISLPVAVQLGSNSAGISLQGQGHTITAQHPLFAPYIPIGPSLGLITPGRTLALIGGQIDLDGAVLTAPEGQIELGAVSQGEVGLGPTFDYAKAAVLGDIQLKNRSLLDVNGVKAGSIHLQGRQVNLTDGSVLWVQNRSAMPAGNIRIDASAGVQIMGATPNRQIVSSIINETVAPGRGGNIAIASPKIQVLDGGSILTKTFSQAASGMVSVYTNDLEVSGSVPQSPDIFSNLASSTFGPGNAGSVNVVTQNLDIHTGGYIGSSTLGTGRGGDVTVQARAITVEGATPILIASTIASATIGRGGDSGDLTVNTGRLKLVNSGLITSSSIGQGSAGNLVVNASEWIEVGGRLGEGLYQSSIASGITYPQPVYAQLFGLTGTPTGTSGNVTVNTPRLSMNNASINTANVTSGDAGTVRVNADLLRVENESWISALTKTGEGGNVIVQSKNLVIRGNSYLSATAGGLGNGGNVQVNAPIILGWENGDIVANAVRGRGGKVEITTQGIFGLNYREQLTPGNDITASSELGVSGTVQVNRIGVNPMSDLVMLPGEPIDPSQKIAAGCGAQQNSSFVITGRAGIPDNPSQYNTANRSWSDLRTMNRTKLPMGVTETAIEATTLQANSQGQMELIAERFTAPNLSMVTCAKPR